jgi:phosphatidylserine synthase
MKTSYTVVIPFVIAGIYRYCDINVSTFQTLKESKEKQVRV